MVAALGFALLMLCTAAPARAVDLPNPVGGIGDAILDKICPPRDAPYPAAPSTAVVARGGGDGTYANYGYAGLRWTTWDAGCLSWDKADTSMGSTINSLAGAIDEFINEVQMTAIDDDTTASFDVVIEKAVGGLRAAFWNKWAATGLVLCGILIAGYTLSGRESDAMSSVLYAVAVIGVVFLLFARPSLPADVGNTMTSGVAEGVASSLIDVTPTSTISDGATAQERLGEGFYQVSYRAWLEGWSCGDVDAENRYGTRLLDAQAFSVKQYLATSSEPDAAAALVKSKQDAWLKIGEQMEKTNPVAFGCWKGEGSSRTGAAMKHAIVTISAGFWIVLGSLALLALKWVLRLAVLFIVAFGPLMLFSQRMRDRMTEFALLGLLGPPLVATGVGTLLWGYYAILLDRQQAWWQAGVSAFALGMALWFAKGILGRLFVGVREVSRAGHMGRRGAHRARSALAPTGIGTWSGGGAAAGAAAGAATGGVAGVVASKVAGGNDDSPRDEPGELRTERVPMAHADAPREQGGGDDAGRWSPPQDEGQGDDAPRTGAAAEAVARARAMVERHGGTAVYPTASTAADAPMVDGADNPRYAPAGSPLLAPSLEELHEPYEGWRQEREGDWAPPERRPVPTDDDIRRVINGDVDSPRYADPDAPVVES
jgi:hypothetical protein